MLTWPMLACSQGQLLTPHRKKQLGMTEDLERWMRTVTGTLTCSPSIVLQWDDQMMSEHCN